MLYNLFMRKVKEYLPRIWFPCILTGFFLLFALMSRWAPVAGDDWGYAVGGRYNPALYKAFEFYRIWSGRFFSELWGFIMAPHKKLWNIANPLIFTGVLYMLVRNSGKNEHPYLIPVLAVMLMLTVPNGLRKQTYTWIMGTTYVIPLLLFLVYLYLLRKVLFREEKRRIIKVILGILAFCIPLYMENAAAMIAGINVLICIFVYFRKRESLREILIYTCISIVGLLLIRFAPGAVYRMARDHQNFRTLSLLGKISVNWIQFIRWTFVNNSVVIITLSVVMILYVSAQKKSLLNWLLILVFAYGILQGSSSWLYGLTGWEGFEVLYDLEKGSSLLINTIGYTLYTTGLFAAVLLYLEDDEKKWTCTALLFCAGGANLVMLISPIFDVRSSIYTVYMFILLILFILEEIHLPEKFAGCLLVCGIVVCLSRVYTFYDLYHHIHLVDIKRNSQIEYYRQRPEIKEAYILGYPIDWVHAADVVEGDDYHMEYFRTYYYLEEDLVLHFYYLQNYDEEGILNG